MINNNQGNTGRLDDTGTTSSSSASSAIEVVNIDVTSDDGHADNDDEIFWDFDEGNVFTSNNDDATFSSTTGVAGTAPTKRRNHHHRHHPGEIVGGEWNLSSSTSRTAEGEGQCCGGGGFFGSGGSNGSGNIIPTILNSFQKTMMTTVTMKNKKKHTQSSNNNIIDNELDKVVDDIIEVANSYDYDDVDDYDNVEDPNDILSKEFAKLTHEERIAITEDIHGITKNDEGDDGDETNVEYIQTKLRQLQQEIKKLPTKSKEDYKRACFLAPNKYEYNPNLPIKITNATTTSITDGTTATTTTRSRSTNCRILTGNEFHLMFLRSTRFDPVFAAKKLVSYFQVKCDLFGPEKIAKEITLHDLDEEDMKALHDGNYMFLPLLDMAGRNILFLNETEYTYTDDPVKFKHTLRAAWYVMCTALQDNIDDIQRHGIVYIMYDVSATPAQQRQYVRNITQNMDFYHSLPNKITSYHYCYKDHTLRSSLSLIFKIVRHFFKGRFRDHHGTHHMECQYQLLSYGIPTSALSVDSDGNVRHDIIENYIAKQEIRDSKLLDSIQQQESATDSNNGCIYVTCATDKDVLLGRGVPYFTHPGNVQLTAIIEQRKDEIDHCSTKFEKTALSWDIVKQVQQDLGGRFLVKDASRGGAWRIADDAAARLKVAYAFRDTKKVLLQKRQRQQENEVQKQLQQRNRTFNVDSAPTTPQVLLDSATKPINYKNESTATDDLRMNDYYRTQQQQNSYSGYGRDGSGNGWWMFWNNGNMNHPVDNDKNNIKRRRFD